MGMKSGIFIVVLLLCLSVPAASAEEMIDSQNYVSSDGVANPAMNYVVTSPTQSMPTAVPEFPVVALPLGIAVGLIGAAFVIRR